MSRGSTRFPGLFDLAMRRPSLLQMIPAWIYLRMYGAYNDQLPCPFNGVDITSHLDKIEKVYSLLTDEDSKLTLLNVLMYRLTLNREYVIRAYSQTPQYFIEAFRGLGPEEIYVDCGAYTGDTYEMYCHFNEPPRHAYLFEPDRQNAHRLRENLKDLPEYSGINIIEKGVHKSTGSLCFRGKRGAGSSFTEDIPANSEALPVTSIDDAIDERITFLKMDIEGAEQNAITGAENRIAKDYPRLAISVYHSTSDLWEIPLMIQQKFPEYSTYMLRHHTTFFGDTILYVYRQG